ncbi:hypothetical protein [Jeotgalibacillus sp. JSM ZJ347]|uniref:hypothetical protein n=1 Tax=Jeotgalibacillus sp. JSM ZJ347 TaxID=3342117 RepID=UPI0035A907FF
MMSVGGLDSLKVYTNATNIVECIHNLIQNLPTTIGINSFILRKTTIQTISKIASAFHQVDSNLRKEDLRKSIEFCQNLEVQITELFERGVIEEATYKEVMNVIILQKKLAFGYLNYLKENCE